MAAAQDVLNVVTTLGFVSHRLDHLVGERGTVSFGSVTPGPCQGPPLPISRRYFTRACIAGITVGPWDLSSTISSSSFPAWSGPSTRHDSGPRQSRPRPPRCGGRGGRHRRGPRGGADRSTSTDSHYGTRGWGTCPVAEGQLGRSPGVGQTRRGGLNAATTRAWTSRTGRCVGRPARPAHAGPCRSTRPHARRRAVRR